MTVSHDSAINNKVCTVKATKLTALQRPGPQFANFSANIALAIS